MTIEIHQPEIEALIRQRLASGAFRDAEEVLIHALKSAPLSKTPLKKAPKRTGADLAAAMQAMPYKDMQFGKESALKPSLEEVFAMVRGLADELDLAAVISAYWRLASSTARRSPISDLN